MLYEKTSISPCYHFFSFRASRRETSPGTFIPPRCNRRSCHRLLYFQQCPSETIFHMLLHIPSQPGKQIQNNPAAKLLEGFFCFLRDFSLMRYTHVLFSSTGFPYKRILTHFRCFVNPVFSGASSHPSFPARKIDVGPSAPPMMATLAESSSSMPDISISVCWKSSSRESSSASFSGDFAYSFSSFRFFVPVIAVTIFSSI